MKIPWTAKEEKDLLEKFYNGLDAQEISEVLLRSYGSVARKIFAMRRDGRLVGYTPKIREDIIKNVLKKNKSYDSFEEVICFLKFRFCQGSFERIKKKLS